MENQKPHPAPFRLPAHEVVYRRLRDQLLYGDLAPGQAVTIQGLTQDLQAGMTPVREALRRLTAEGALQFLGNRRITVPVLGADEMEQLLVARIAIESELARRACLRMGEAEIDALADIDAQLDSAIRRGGLYDYLRLNHAFHTTLYDHADASILRALVDGLWLRFGPSLRGVLSMVAPRDTPDMHKVLVQALRARDSTAAARAVSEDVAQGMTRLRDVLTESLDLVESREG